MTGRNDPCPCGSGQKFKRCHLGRETELENVNPKPSSKSIIRAGRVSPERDVPKHIPRPDYIRGGKSPIRRTEVEKNADQIDRIRKACRVAREVLEETKKAVAVGVTTEELDVIAHEAAIARGAYPSPLGYQGFPKSICTSINEVICHGIPDDRPLASGDTINVDITVFIHGMHGDLSETVLVGDVAEEHKKLVEVTRQSLYIGIEQVKPGAPIADIGRAIEAFAGDQHHYGIVRDFVGHGIGELFHMDPHVPHFFKPTATFTIKPGMTFTLEPMINIGTHSHDVWPDNWTAVTRDRERSAQFEHTVLVTEDGVEILTLGDGESQP